MVRLVAAVIQRGLASDNPCRSAYLAGRRPENQEALARSARGPFRQADAPAATAALVCAHQYRVIGEACTDLPVTFRPDRS